MKKTGKVYPANQGVRKKRQRRKKYAIVEESSTDQEFPKWIANPIKDGRLIIDSFVDLSCFGGLVYLQEGKTCRVSLAQYKGGKYYALKGISKHFLCKSRSYEQVKRQLEIHIGINHKFIVNCFRVFDHHSFIYSIQEYCVGGTLQMLLDNKRAVIPSISPEAAKFYVAEVAVALDHLHSRHNIVFRNLSAENVGLSWSGHVKLLGFQFATKVKYRNPLVETSATSTVGAIECAAPELLPFKLIEPFLAEEADGRTFHSFAVDWWALGVLLHQLVMGFRPFGNPKFDSQSDIAKAILRNHRQYRLYAAVYRHRLRPTGVLQLIDNLLANDQDQRWCLDDIKECDFFKGCKWNTIFKVEAPYKPKYALVEKDTTCFRRPIKVRKKEMTIGVYPEELRVRPTSEHLEYSYATDICNDIMARALKGHTVRARKSVEALAQCKVASVPDGKSPMLLLLEKGLEKKHQRRKRQKEQFLRNYEQANTIKTRDKLEGRGRRWLDY